MVENIINVTILLIHIVVIEVDTAPVNIVVYLCFRHQSYILQRINRQTLTALNTSLTAYAVTWFIKRTNIVTDTLPSEYRFTDPDPYFKLQPLPADRKRHDVWFDEEGHLHAKRNRSTGNTDSKH